MPSAPVRVLVLFYSYSGQSSVLIRRLVAGLSDEGVEVCQERLQPRQLLRFPLGSVVKTIWLMIITFFRTRFAIQPLAVSDDDPFDLVVLAGPTWSWSPSGPVLTLLDQHPGLFRQRPVLAVISCRGYWRAHWRYLRKRLTGLGADPFGPLVFSHPQREPWRTIGVFLKVAGMAPERSSSLFSRLYPRFGHTRQQCDEAYALGRQLATRLKSGVGAEKVRDFKCLP
ncbi:hypothetical protein [Desulfurivibrio alkaliphilus]|uniref:Flavodoxin n=1 Tax=Desulfurivibrio alkaliphilus (strain DSM 19089 / UNIQEM U267 / AHT2) TaxID=589865 RepID=D6Z563_DESAT|nr:hypothetical protein [Desulfurivibrio alkaliphilus]ADH84720.1 conserved hypothetical protein [Desulfurivibrio alkaliphilus AHT 2]